MNKILLSLLMVTPFLNAKMMFSPETQQFYSTNMKSEHSTIKYNILADYADKMINAAYYEEIDVNQVIMSIKLSLLVDGSPEAELLYDDLKEVWG